MVGRFYQRICAGVWVGLLAACSEQLAPAISAPPTLGIPARLVLPNCCIVWLLSMLCLI